MSDSKSELKRLCTMDPIGMAQRIYKLEAASEKDRAEIERLKNELYEQKEKTSRVRIKAMTELAAALAACEVKDSALNKAEEYLRPQWNYKGARLHEYMQKALAIRPDSKVLDEVKAKWLVEMADEILETVSHSDVDNHDFENGKEAAAQWMKIKASELRNTKTGE